MRYFLYCRKSTEAEDRQVMSIDSQKSEAARSFGKVESIDIIHVFEESFSAKEPGRPVFNEMLKRIEKGEVDGIIAWHPDRLARNSVDGGRIIHLLDKGILKDLKFSTFNFENNPHGKLMLAMLFGFSKYYVDALSENVKRGNRTKIDRGWRPAQAPLGYRNDAETKTTVTDGIHFTTMERIFRLALSGTHSVKSILRITTEVWGYRMPENKRYGGRPLAMSTLYKIFANPFYAGHFYWNGRLYQGKHKPMINMEEFRRVQEWLGRSLKEKPQKYSFPFTGLMRCGTCGLMVTAEHKTNLQGHRYIYYHCTKRANGPRCIEPYIEGRAMEAQFLDFINSVVVDEATAKEMVTHLASKRANSLQQIGMASESIAQELRTMQLQLSTLTDLRVRGLIADDEYLARRREIEVNTAAANERLEKSKDSSEWFELAELLISFNKQAVLWFTNGTDDIKRHIVNSLGSNFTLKDKKLNGEAVKPFSRQVENAHFL